MSALPTGIYNFAWSGGTFEVQLRARNIFWCPQFPAAATWAFSAETQTLEIDWGKYGQYVLKVQGSELVGGVRGNESDWRKASFKRAFTPQEELVSGSAWMLHFENGVPFRIELRADGHFHCASYPGHFSYKLNSEAGTLAIEWGKYGSYDFTIDVEKKVLTGALRGNPASWRRCESKTTGKTTSKTTSKTTNPNPKPNRDSNPNPNPNPSPSPNTNTNTNTYTYRTPTRLRGAGSSTPSRSPPSCSTSTASTRTERPAAHRVRLRCGL